MRRIALTGGIATGKSHVRAEFEALGVPTIDADVLAKQAVEPGSPGLAAVTARFGRDVLNAAGALDRRKLGAIVFRRIGAPRSRADFSSGRSQGDRRLVRVAEGFPRVRHSRHPAAL